MVKPIKPSEETLEYIKDYFEYNPNTGELVRFSVKFQEWRECANAHDSGRLRVGIMYGTYYVANICWFLYHGTWPKNEVDHEDGNGFNNIITNLRESGHSKNSRNKDNRIKNTYHGVTFHTMGMKFRYRFSIEGKSYEVYGFDSAMDAAVAREKHLDELGDKFCKRNNVR